MSAFGRARAWVRAVVARRRLEREMHEELATHVAQAAERYMARGMSEQDARLAARREFGHLGAVQEAARDARGGRWADSIAIDLKYAFRYFARTPLATITIVLTLALGIGFSTAVYSVIASILTRPAPGVPADPALVKIRGLSNVRPFWRALSYQELSAYATLTDKFASVAGWTSSSAVVDAGDTDLGVMSATAHFVTPNFFGTLGIELASGHRFAQSRFGELAPAELSAIVSHSFASERFGGAKGAVGQQVKVNDVAVTIIGVTQPGFNGAVPSGAARSIWLPLSARQLIVGGNGQIFADPNAWRFDGFARLRPHITIEEALPAVRLTAARSDANARTVVPRTWTGTADVVALRGSVNEIGRFDADIKAGFAAFSAIALVILLVCTTTVNSLLVGAAVARRYEIGVRLAMGASCARVVRQLLTEISILAIAGGVLGMYIFGALSRLIEQAKDGFDVSPNWSTIAFTLLYALITATLSGLSPALHATRTGVSDVLKDNPAGAARKSRLQRTFVVAQIAIAQPLMVGLAAVLSTVLVRIPSFGDATLRERLLVAAFETHAGFNLRAPDKIPGLMQHIAALPSVVAVLPLGGVDRELSLSLPASASSVPFVTAVFNVSPGYFRTIDAPIVLGREFVATDTTFTVTPLVISDTVAAEVFKGANPIGRRVSALWQFSQTPVAMEIIGVVRVNQETNAQRPINHYPLAFVPFQRQREGVLLIRTSGPAEALIPTVTAVARKEAPTLPVDQVRTLAESDRRGRSDWLQVAGTITGCATIVLILASIGLYAMLTIAVGQRRREIGIRIALGADARQVVRMFFTRGLLVTLMGLALGGPLSIAALGILSRTIHMPWEYNLAGVAVLVTLTVVSVASLASWLPARRAASVDPMLALRSE